MEYIEVARKAIAAMEGGSLRKVQNIRYSVEMDELKVLYLTMPDRIKVFTSLKGQITRY